VKTKSRSHDLQCSFCSKGKDHVKKLIAGPGVYICDECIDLCNRIVDEEQGGGTAALRHPEGSDEEQLQRMVSLHRSREQVDNQVALAVRALRERGVTWTRIGAALGISRQSAWERYSGEE
jgi:hypothetical protein